jgi:hypothetical protein
MVQNKRRHVAADEPIRAFTAAKAAEEDILESNAHNRFHNSNTIFLIRSWLAIGARRRSTKLLARAFALAARTGIELDAIFTAGSFGSLETIAKASPYVRCAFFDCDLHSMIPLVPTPARLNRACV